MASTIKRELARAGRNAPLVRANALVELVENKQLTTPFLVPEASLQGLFHTSYSTSLDDMMRASSSFYQLPSKEEHVKGNSNAGEEISTSSVSDGNSEDSRSNCNRNTCDDPSNETASEPKAELVPSSISMGEALAISTEPRYVSIQSLFILCNLFTMNRILTVLLSLSFTV
jgi:hypothetical protein